MRSERILAILAILTSGLWFGGMLALGAIVAPTVFGTLDLPVAAEAMTRVFQRWDKVALGCAGGLIALEAIGFSLPARPAPYARARVALTVLVALGAVVEAKFISPAIAALHNQGAKRGIGDLGLALDGMHQRAEAIGKASVLFLVVIIVLHVARVAAATPSQPPRA